MKILVYSYRKFESDYIKNANFEHNFELTYCESHLDELTVKISEGMDAVACFAGDNLSTKIIDALADNGIKLILLRSAGYNHVDLNQAKKRKIAVARVPAYSPYAIAEHTVAMMLSLNRKIVQANQRVKSLNFSLNGLVGFDMHKKVVGIIGTGKIGEKLAYILNGFGCELLAYDIEENETLKKKTAIKYVSLDELLQNSDILSLHVPLNDQTKYLLNEQSLAKTKKGVMLINTSRGGLVDTKAVIDLLKKRHIAYLGLDVYEEEEGLFFEDHSGDILQDDVIARLLTFPNVLITSHQAFLTETALKNIADITLENAKNYLAGNFNDHFLVNGK